MPYATRIDDATWEKYKLTIECLYIQEQRSLSGPDGVIEIMNKHHGFQASSAQYEARFRKWRIRKNLTRKKWRQIFRAVQDRLRQGKLSEIRIHGVTLSLERMERESNRSDYRDFRKLSPGLSEGIEVVTPPKCSGSVLSGDGVVGSFVNEAPASRHPSSLGDAVSTHSTVKSEVIWTGRAWRLMHKKRIEECVMEARKRARLKRDLSRLEMMADRLRIRSNIELRIEFLGGIEDNGLHKLAETDAWIEQTMDALGEKTVSPPDDLVWGTPQKATNSFRLYVHQAVEQFLVDTEAERAAFEKEDADRAAIAAEESSRAQALERQAALRERFVYDQTVNIWDAFDWENEGVSWAEWLAFGWDKVTEGMELDRGTAARCLTSIVF